jgi:hypothetical protein
MQDSKGILQGVIVAALVVIAGLLFSIYRKMESPKPETVAVTQPASPPGAPSPAAAAETSAPVHKSSPAPKHPVEKAAEAAPTPPVPIPVKTAESSVPVAQPPDPVPAPAPQAPPPSPPVPPPPPRTVTVPVGTSFTVRLLDRIDSERNRQGDTFQTSLEDPLVAEGVVVAPRGSTVIGRLVESKRAGRVTGVAEMTLTLEKMRTICGDQRIESEVIKREGPTSRGTDAAKIGVLTGLGAVIGALAGHGKGAAIGAGSGAVVGTGDVIATRGKPLKLSPETRLVFRLSAPLTLNADGSTNYNNTPAPDVNRPYLIRKPD